jgi:2-polyprenyl-3-methyl-5-hydroxy-6-metoxy-1,4-benzoquinol methylase
MTKRNKQMSNPDIKTLVRDQFSVAAANYSTSPVHASAPDLAFMTNALVLTGYEEVLDAGCGAGHTALSFAPYVRSVTAIDLSQAMLDQAAALAQQRNLFNLDYRQMDVEQLTFEAASFDLVTTRYSAHHWPHPQQALAQLRRVLRPQGNVLLSDIVSWDDPATDTFLQAIELLRDPSHVRDHSIKQWLALFSETGFVAVEVVSSWDVRLEFASWIARMATPDDRTAVIRKLLAMAPDEVRKSLAVEQDDAFTLKGALFRASV